MGFWDDYEPKEDELPGFASVAERATLVESGAPIQIERVRFDDQTRFGPRWYVDFTFDQNGDTAHRTIGFKKDTAGGARDDLFENMRAWLDRNKGQTVPAKIAKGKNRAYVIEPV